MPPKRGGRKRALPCVIDLTDDSEPSISGRHAKIPRSEAAPPPSSSFSRVPSSSFSSGLSSSQSAYFSSSQPSTSARPRWPSSSIPASSSDDPFSSSVFESDRDGELAVYDLTQTEEGPERELYGFLGMAYLPTDQVIILCISLT